MRSFRLEKQREPFMQTSPTIQSLYWLILGIVVVAFAVWIYTLQAQVQDIYDQIDRVNAESEAVVIPKKTER